MRRMRMRSRLLRTLALAALCAVLSACASIPLGTLWQLRGFGAEELAALAPEQLRVAARADAPPMALGADGLRLVLELTPRDAARGPERHVFALRPARVGDAALAPPGGRPWQVYALDEAGLRAMRALQPRLATAKTHYRAFSFSVGSDFDDTLPPGTREVVFSVRLRLSDAQAPFTLFDRAKIPVGDD